MRTWQIDGEGAALAPSYSRTLRCPLANRPGTLAVLIGTIGDLSGGMGVIDIVHAESDHVTRDISIFTGGAEHGQRIAEAVGSIVDVELLHVSDRCTPDAPRRLDGDRQQSFAQDPR